MKNKILSILGVVTVLTSLLAITGVTQVSAGPQSWSSIPAPATSNSTEWVGPIARAVDGTLYTSAGQYNGKNDGSEGDFIYKSTDNGRTWVKTATQPSETGLGMPISAATMPDVLTDGATQKSVITDIQCPGADGNTVYVTDGYDIFKSVNGGATWSADVNLFNAGVGANGFIVSISIGYIGTNAYVFAGTSTFGFGENGDAFVLQESVYNNPWADLHVGTNRPGAGFNDRDVIKVQVDPSFATTQMVMAVVSDYSDGKTIVTTKYGSLEWDTTANDVVLAHTVLGVPTNSSTPLLTGSIYMPSDFTSNVASGNMVAFVGIASMPGYDTTVNGEGDVYLCYFGAAAATPTTAFDLNVAGANTAFNVSGMSGVGTAAASDIMVGGWTNQSNGAPFATPQVYTSMNSGVTWTLAAKGPTGGLSPLTSVLSAEVPLCSVMMKSDFATSGTAIIGTHGIDCGLSGTTDSGNSFNTLSPNTTVTGGVNFTATNLTTVGKISLATDGTIYETSYSSGSGAAAVVTLSQANSGVTLAPLSGITSEGVLYMVAPTVTVSGGTFSSGSTQDTATASVDGFGHVTQIIVTSHGSTYATAPTLTITPAAGDMEYSAWRYSPTNSAWDRIDSWSLYTSPIQFNMISTTPAQDAVFISNNAGLQLYRSTNKGQTWMMWGQPVPNTNGNINSWLVVNSTTVLIGTVGNGTTTGGNIFMTTNGAVWLARQAFTNATVAVTSIVLAPNGDYLAAGVDSLGDINIASSTGGTTWTSKDEGPSTGLSIRAATTAYIAPAADYTTSKIVYFAGDGVTNNASVTNGIWYSTISGTPTRADGSSTTGSNWVQQLANPITGLITAAGGPGFTPEGTGMTYATTVAGVMRVKGRITSTGPTAAAEQIANPTGATLSGLYISTNSVGNVTLYAVGVSNKNIYTYSDTLNGAVAGVAASNVTTASTGGNAGLSSATISWTATANASNYLVVVDNTAQWTNLYDAENYIDSTFGTNASTMIAWAFTTTPSVSFTNKLASNTTYYVSVWALKNNSSTPITVGANVTPLLGSAVLSTFGGTVSFTTPLTVPTTPNNLVPILGSTISPVNPNFDWMTVPGATSYTLQLTTASDPGFASPVYVNSAVPAVSGPTTSFTYVGTLAYNASYIWRVEANGTAASTWVSGNFYTALAVTPPVTVTTVPQPTIVITQQPAVTITQQAPVPTPTLVVTSPVYTLVTPTATTPTYIWVIVAVGAVLTLAVIVLIIRTRRVV